MSQQVLDGRTLSENLKSGKIRISNFLDVEFDFISSFSNFEFFGQKIRQIEGRYALLGYKVNKLSRIFFAF